MNHASDTPRCPVLASAAQALARSHQVGGELLRVLDDETGNRPPRPGKWSALQAIEHLNVIADRYRPHMERAIAGAHPGTAPYGDGTLLGRLLVRSVEPSSKRPLPAPRLYHPPTVHLYRDEVSRRFDAHHRVWQELARAADGLDLGRARVRLPVSNLLTISLAQAFALHVAHEARHLEQARRAFELARARAS